MAVFNAMRTRNARLIEGFHQRVHPFPASLVIEPISICNYACCGCHAGLGDLKRGGLLDMGTLNDHVLPVIPDVRQVRLYNYGEPFLHPHIIDIIGSIRRKNRALNLHISTNGQLMTKEIAEGLVDAQVNYLIVSVHGGPTQEGLLKYSRRGPEIDVITANIDYLVKLKKRKGKRLPWIFLKAILFKWNDSEEEMEAFLELGKTLGVDFAGWGANSSDPALSSTRVAPGTQPYQDLVEKKLLESNFYELPAWPAETGV
jgi:MoaA/NifB/PqqE/SkfB family radical SAM enzyme